MSKPLFIPLKRDYFEAFERGEKREEYRPFGPRWNRRTCEIGRSVVLSLGYGKRRRLIGVVTSFRVELAPAVLPGWVECYGKTPRAEAAACIGITVHQTAGTQKLKYCSESPVRPAQFHAADRFKPALPPPDRPGFWWIRHVKPLLGKWQPVAVDSRYGVLGFKKFDWQGWMAVSEAEPAGMEWGPECVFPAAEEPRTTDTQPGGDLA